MKKWIKPLFSLFIIVLVGMQFVPTQRNKTESVTPADFIKYYQPPIVIGKLIRSSCYDCHSNQTKYPWYSKIQPIGLLLQKHVSEGKSELNLSKFGDLSSRMKQMKLKSILNQINDQKMPLPSYLMLHPEAILDSSNRVILVNYIDTLTYH